MNKEIYDAINGVIEADMENYALVLDVGCTKILVGFSKKKFENKEISRKLILPSSILIRYPNKFDTSLSIGGVSGKIKEKAEILPCVDLGSFQEIRNYDEEGCGLAEIESWKADFLKKGKISCELNIVVGEAPKKMIHNVKIEEIYAGILKYCLESLGEDQKKSDLIIGFSVPNYSNDVMERFSKVFKEKFSKNYRIKFFPETKCASYYHILKNNIGGSFTEDYYHMLAETGGSSTDISLTGGDKDNLDVLKSVSLDVGGTHQTNELVSVVSKEIFEKFKIKLDVNNREIFKDVEDFKIHYIIQEKGKISKGKKKCFFKFIENKCQKTPNESFVEIEHETIRNCLSMGADVVAKEMDEYIKYVDEMNIKKNRFGNAKKKVKIYFCGGNFNNSIYRDAVKAKLNLAQDIKTYTEPKQIIIGLYLLIKFTQLGKDFLKGLKYKKLLTMESDDSNELIYWVYLLIDTFNKTTKFEKLNERNPSLDAKEVTLEGYGKKKFKLIEFPMIIMEINGIMFYLGTVKVYVADKISFLISGDYVDGKFIVRVGEKQQVELKKGIEIDKKYIETMDIFKNNFKLKCDVDDEFEKLDKEFNYPIIVLDKAYKNSKLQYFNEFRDSQMSPRKRRSMRGSKKVEKIVEKKVEADGIFIVEEILRSKLVNGNKQYLVKWEGYPTSDNTWEPKDCFSDEMIEEFENNEQNVKKRPRTARKVREGPISKKNKK